jgi:gamma-glutamylcyclotransferase (GGCT)/AIG2-like uncharacterized protein YtfP
VTGTASLFAYGTLRQSNVQIATFGRKLEGKPDTLAGYALSPLAISDAYVVRTSELAVHTAAHFTGNPADAVSGITYALTDAELHSADEYEVAVMVRIEVTLGSGARSFVYVRADSA